MGVSRKPQATGSCYFPRPVIITGVVPARFQVPHRVAHGFTNTKNYTVRGNPVIMTPTPTTITSPPRFRAGLRNQTPDHRRGDLPHPSLLIRLAGALLAEWATGPNSRADAGPLRYTTASLHVTGWAKTLISSGAGSVWWR